LRQAVRRLERQPKEDDRTVTEWKGLVAARWTLLGHFVADGKRYLVARRNQAPREGVPGLTPREREATAHAALGQTNKIIGWEMGVSPETVGVFLHRAARKLGVENRAELIAAYLGGRKGDRAGAE
jgi:DNA-binding CsgD family transcriptional regulator